MTDFVSGLRGELVAAAAREQRRGRARPAAPRLRRALPALAAAALAALALVLVLGRDQPGEERQAVTPPQSARPLFGGTLEPGVRYRSRALEPALSFQPGDANWMADFTDEAGGFVLSRERDSAPPLGYLFLGRPFEVYDPGVAGLEGSRTAAPADLLAWLRAHPDIEAGKPRAARLAGRDARVLDLTFRFQRPTHPAPQCRDRGYRCAALGPEDAFRNGDRSRVYVVESGPGPLVVAVNAFGDAEFRAMLPQAQKLLASLEIEG